MIDLTALYAPWSAPALPETIPHGDMPGDKVVIGEEHVRKAARIFPQLKGMLAACLEKSPSRRAVIAVCGGSGVGKSEIASLLSFYLNALGIGAYTLSGDNYPHRYPEMNDAERLRVFREGGIKGLLVSGAYGEDTRAALDAMWAADSDAAKEAAAAHPWMAIYQQAGRNALRDYLGTKKEIDFDMLERIVSSFKQGAEMLCLKRMGRTDTALWYDRVDMRGIQVLVIEWTHGNSNWFEGVDIPVLLNSTPAETLAHRQKRNRDGKADSAFTTMVLEIEQQMLEAQAHKAKIILSKAGEIMSYADYRQQMANG